MSVQETQFALKDLLDNKKVPNCVIKGNLEVDSIEKSLLILQKKFSFATTSKLKLSCFQCVKQSLKALLDIKFPVIISVQAQCATYNHVVVIWRKMVIDYESKYIYLLTEDSLRQVCGFTTTFQRITPLFSFHLPSIPSLNVCASHKVTQSSSQLSLNHTFLCHQLFHYVWTCVGSHICFVSLL